MFFVVCGLGLFGGLAVFCGLFGCGFATEQLLNCSEGGFRVFSGFLSLIGGLEGSGWVSPYSFLHIPTIRAHKKNCINLN